MDVICHEINELNKNLYKINIVEILDSCDLIVTYKYTERI